MGFHCIFTEMFITVFKIRRSADTYTYIYEYSYIFGVSWGVWLWYMQCYANNNITVFQFVKLSRNSFDARLVFLFVLYDIPCLSWSSIVCLSFNYSFIDRIIIITRVWVNTWHLSLKPKSHSRVSYLNRYVKLVMQLRQNSAEASIVYYTIRSNWLVEYRLTYNVFSKIENNDIYVLENECCVFLGPKTP